MNYLIKNINDFNKIDINNFYSQMNKIDKKKFDKISNYRRKKQFIIGRILLRTLLLDVYNIDYFNINLSSNTNGKPYINSKNIYFNISHSFDYVICCVSNKKIGVDIEKIRNTTPNQIKQFATEKEINYINNNEKNAFQIYCLKEAYFKMKGENLNMIKNIEFNLENKIICNDKNIDIKIITNVGGYVGAICEEKI